MHMGKAKQMLGAFFFSHRRTCVMLDPLPPRMPGLVPDRPIPGVIREALRRPSGSDLDVVNQWQIFNCRRGCF